MNGVKKIRGLILSVLLAAPVLGAPPEPEPPPPGQHVTVHVVSGTESAPSVSFVLGPRHGHVTPARRGCSHTGGGNIDIAQPSPDTLLIAMSGVAVAYGSICAASAEQNFVLDQAFEVRFDDAKIKKAKLTMEGRVIGLLRTHGHHDTAGYDNACAAVLAGPAPLLHLCVPPHAVAGGENLSVNDHAGPVSVLIAAGKYCLRQTFTVSALAHACLLCKGPSAEFAPAPALDPLWISYREPFHGALKKDFGFQLILHVVADTEKTKNDDSPEKLPPPKTVD